MEKYKRKGGVFTEWQKKNRGVDNAEMKNPLLYISTIMTSHVS